MKFTRDAAVWNISFVSSVLAFLGTQFGLLHAAFPALTDVADARITCAAAIVGFIAGYMKMSPLPLSPDHPLATNEASVALSPVNSSTVIGILLACVLGAMTAACGSKSYHVAVVADNALYEVLRDIHAGEQTVLCGEPSCAGVAARPTPTWSDAKSQAFNTTLLPAVEAGRQFNVILGTVKPGEPLPPQLSGLITSLSVALTAIAKDVPEGTTKSAVLANIGKAQALVLDALSLVLSVKGR